MTISNVSPLSQGERDNYAATLALVEKVFPDLPRTSPANRSRGSGRHSLVVREILQSYEQDRQRMLKTLES